MMGEDHESEGKILQLRNTNEEVQTPPTRLSQIPLFSDIQNMIVQEGIIPYDVNASLWSDGASKKRWIE